MNWRELNQQLREMDESTVKQMLDDELIGERRSVFIERLHARYNVLRVARERKEMLADGVVS